MQTDKKAELQSRRHIERQTKFVWPYCSVREGRVIKHKNALFKVNNSKLAQANTRESNHGYRPT